MHAHKQTGLRKLGVKDADRVSPEHDLAVQYLSTPETARRLCGLHSDGLVADLSNPVVIPEMRLESKSGGTSGFVDLALVVFWKRTVVRLVVEVKTVPGYVGEALRQLLHYNGLNACWQAHKQACAVLGVDMPPRCIGSGGRDMSSVQVVDLLVLATTFPVSKADERMLGAQAVRHAYLGEQYRSWADSMRAASELADSVEL